MEKILCLLLTFCLTFGLAACGNDGSQNGSGQDAAGGMNPLPSRKKTEMMVLQMQKLRIRKTEVFLASRKTRRM